MSRMGRINVFQGICHSFPYYSLYYNENVMKNSTQLIMAFNSFISSICQTHLGDFNQLIHFISCEDEDVCHIRIHYIDQKNGIKLQEKNKILLNILMQMKRNFMKLKLFLMQLKKIKWKLDIFSGDVSIEFSDKINLLFF